MNRLTALQIIQKSAAFLEKGDGNLSEYEYTVHRLALLTAFKALEGDHVESELRSAFLSGYAAALEDGPDASRALGREAWNVEAKNHLGTFWSGGLIALTEAQVEALA